MAATIPIITTTVPVPKMAACIGVIFAPLSVNSSLSYHAPGSTTLPFQSTLRVELLFNVSVSFFEDVSEVTVEFLFSDGVGEELSVFVETVLFVDVDLVVSNTGIAGSSFASW